MEMAAEEEAAAVTVAEEAAPAPAPATAARREKRAPADGDEEEKELPGTKRRRACVAALGNVRRGPAEAAAASEDGDEGAGEPEPAADGCDGGSSFSFHARSFSGVETTPRFGSFNPADELVAFQLKSLQPPMDAPAKEAVASGGGGGGGGDDDKEKVKETAAMDRDGNSHYHGKLATGNSRQDEGNECNRF